MLGIVEIYVFKQHISGSHIGRVLCCPNDWPLAFEYTPVDALYRRWDCFSSDIRVSASYLTAFLSTSAVVKCVIGMPVTIFTHLYISDMF